MDSLRGIEASGPSTGKREVTEAQPSRHSSISLDSLPLGDTLPHGVFALGPCQASQHRHSSPTKSPMLPMMTLETRALDPSRPPSPEVGCPVLPANLGSSPSSSTSPVLPLQAYLLDKNDHERRLLRLSRYSDTVLGTTSVQGSDPVAETGPARQADGATQRSWFSWEVVGRDGEPVEISTNASSLTHKRKAQAAEEDGQCGHKSKRSESAAPEPCPSSPPPPSMSPTSSIASFPRSLGSVIDSAVSNAPSAESAGLATRLLALDRELKDAGLGGLGGGSTCLSGLRYHR
ncbi:hypothetical protein CDD83_10154 [Cordyceps sp. RAO-2017]|nr:hypothetical protein CDD83_10154 [Cordyceps sp. RAO-2017]